MQPRKARTLNVVSVKQQKCTLWNQKWATIDKTPEEGRTLPDALSKKISETETCARAAVNRSVGEKLYTVSLSNRECEHEVTLAPEATRLLNQPRSPAARLVSSTGASERT